MSKVSMEISLNKIKEIIENPPSFIKKAQESVDISCNPLLCGFQLFVFDINDPQLTTLYTFAVRQYSYMESIIDILEKRFVDGKYKVVSFIWSIGTLASAMLENLLQFAFVSDDFNERSRLFYNFSTIQDLENYPTNKIVDGCEIDKIILKNVRVICERYKKKNAKFVSDADYTNRENYVADWYMNIVPNLRTLAAAIKLGLINGGKSVDWNSLYLNYYHYLCDFKHIGWQKTCVSGDIVGAKDMVLQIMNVAVFSFIVLNKIIIYICEEKYHPFTHAEELKKSIEVLKNKISEYEGLFI